MFSVAKLRAKIFTIHNLKPYLWFIGLWLGGLFTTAGLAYSIRLVLKLITQ